MALDPVLFVDFLGYGTAATNIALVTAFLIYIVDRFGPDVRDMTPVKEIESFVSEWSVHLALLFASLATFGSLYLSNVMGWGPCSKCWYQRILVYPTALIIATGLWFRKDDIADYVVPFNIIGIPLSAYHYVIQRYSQFHSAGCTLTQFSCETKHTYYWGVISIPWMALTAQIVILILLWRYTDY
ncbi:MAG: disulfide bond formation protein B [Candidatus Nanohaloarchaea archaeon]